MKFLDRQPIDTFDYWLGMGIEILCKDTIWHKTHLDISNAIDPYKKRFGCVYFMTHIQYANLIKIGITTNIRQRMRSFKSTFGSAPRFIALAQLDEYEMLETLLHRKFDEYNDSGEWFYQEPVTEWLGGVS